MIYNDGPRMDQNMRVTECPRCKNTQIGNDDLYCIICGGELHNRCQGVIEYDFMGNESPGEKHINPSNARYCAWCGAKTRFFEWGYLKPFTEVTDEGIEDGIKSYPDSDGSDEFIPGFEDLPFN